MITLYHWEPNANSGKPILTLKEKGVEFKSHYLDLLNFDQHSPEYLKINPNGTIPAMVHDDLMLYESTAIMEYVDEAFPGPKLSPDEPEARWRMRWWMKFFDQYYAPSASMAGWNFFVGPSVRSKDPELLKQKIEAIPLKERRIAWTKAIYGTFSEEELAESRRRVAYGAELMETELENHTWLAGETYSLADINAFNLCYFMPAQPGGAVSDEKTPKTMEWLRKIYERPATKAAWSLGKTMNTQRLTHLERKR
ncbi:MAG TPA: glutathione S-transferase family protein [Alphaproteobacteria bacterium]|nr:glutathione S-transferase family protein [Alphaproteobacteria bacterium]